VALLTLMHVALPAAAAAACRAQTSDLLARSSANKALQGVQLSRF
jgi:hypothetical protein